MRILALTRPRSEPWEGMEQYRINRLILNEFQFSTGNLRRHSALVMGTAPCRVFFTRPRMERNTLSMKNLHQATASNSQLHRSMCGIALEGPVDIDQNFGTVIARFKNDSWGVDDHLRMQT